MSRFKTGDRVKTVSEGFDRQVFIKNADIWGVEVDAIYEVTKAVQDWIYLRVDDYDQVMFHADYFELVDSGTPEVKPSNPKDVIGSTKPPLHNIPCGPLYLIGAAMLSGACKYGGHNWRAIGVRSDVYYDAMQRHLMAWWEGETLDPESGAPHLAHVAACCVILLDAEAAGKLTDNRPPIVGNPSQAVQELVTSILQKYPNPVESFTEKAL
jgi:hypothetical protein